MAVACERRYSLHYNDPIVEKRCVLILDGKIKLAIIEDNKRLADEIWNYLNATGEFTLAGVAEDGEAGLNLLLHNEIDVALLDIIMPRKDGLYILERLESERIKKRPVCVVLSSTNSETVKAKAFDLGVDYYILKPFDMDLLYSRIKELARYGKSDAAKKKYSRTEAAESYAVSVLTSLGIKETLKGYEYIKTGVTMAIND
ncbi:MAG: response regulator, partial [Clostridiales bacterium]|nr:response regulator [Clostridiales bacterium]